MGQSVSDMISKYTDPQPNQGPLGSNISMSVRMPEESKIMLETVAHHFGVKKSPFLNELVSAAIQDVFDNVKDDMHSDLLNEHAEDVERMINEGLLKGEEENV